MHAKTTSLDADPTYTHLRRGTLVCLSLIYQSFSSDFSTMGCCSSTANVSSNKATEDEPVQMSPVTAHEPVAEDPSTTLSRPPSRTPFSPQPTHGREMTPSPEALRRVMSESSPQPSSSSFGIQRAISVQAGSSASRRQVLTSTVQKVLSNPSKPLKYVAHFWSMACTRLTPP